MQVRLGQTDQGSFVVTLLRPVVPPPIPTLPPDPEDRNAPLERRVTRRLVQAVTATGQATERAAAGDEHAFEETVTGGVSANLWEALARIIEPSPTLDIGVSWARTRPVAIPGTVVRFGRADVILLREAARSLRERAPQPNVRLRFVRSETMADSGLTQPEADTLMALEKRRDGEEEWRYPDFGGAITIPLVSTDRREQFLLDLRRSRIDLAKNTYQNRGRQIVVLVRRDLGARPHRNPDGEEVGSPHLHLYREGYGDKWAYAPPTDRFADLEDPWRTLQDFMQFCRVVEPPAIRRGLFT